MSKLMRSLAVLAVFAAAAVFTGCSSGDSAPSNTMVINGTEVPIASVDVWYASGDRYVRFTDPLGDYVEFTFQNQGDPLVTAYEIPVGHWTGFDSDLTEVYVHLVTGPTNASYDGSTAYSSDLHVGGAPPDVLDMVTAWGFSAGPISDVQVDYAGPYGYFPD
jgi:hypothetical protein